MLQYIYILEQYKRPLEYTQNTSIRSHNNIIHDMILKFSHNKEDPNYINGFFTKEMSSDDLVKIHNEKFYIDGVDINIYVCTIKSARKRRRKFYYALQFIISSKYAKS